MGPVLSLDLVSESYPEAYFMESRGKWMEVFRKWSGSSDVHQTCCSHLSPRSHTCTIQIVAAVITESVNAFSRVFNVLKCVCVTVMIVKTV